MIARMPEFVEVDVADGEAKQVVDFFLRQHALGADLARTSGTTGIIDHSRPLSRQCTGSFVSWFLIIRDRKIAGVERRVPARCGGILICLFLVVDHRLNPVRH